MQSEGGKVGCSQMGGNVGCSQSQVRQDAVRWEVRQDAVRWEVRQDADGGKWCSHVSPYVWDEQLSCFHNISRKFSLSSFVLGGVLNINLTFHKPVQQSTFISISLIRNKRSGIISYFPNFTFSVTSVNSICFCICCQGCSLLTIRSFPVSSCQHSQLSVYLPVGLALLHSVGPYQVHHMYTKIPVCLSETA